MKGNVKKIEPLRIPVCDRGDYRACNGDWSGTEGSGDVCLSPGRARPVLARKGWRRWACGVRARARDTWRRRRRTGNAHASPSQERILRLEPVPRRRHSCQSVTVVASRTTVHNARRRTHAASFYRRPSSVLVCMCL